MMSVAEDTEEFQETKYPHLRTLRGGKGPPEAPVEDWLTPLDQYTTFVCRQNATTLDGEMYYLMFKGEQFYLLKWCLPDGKMWDRYVHPPSFCKHFREHEVLGINPPREVENNNGNSDLRGSTNLVQHASDEGEHQVVQDPEQPDL